MNIRSLVSFAVLTVAAATAFESPCAATQTVRGNYCWIGEVKNVTVNPDPAVFDPTKAVLTSGQSTNFTAVLAAGLKVDSWWRWTQGTTTNGFVKLQSGGNSLTWPYDSQYGTDVGLGLKFNYIKYKLAYNGGSTATETHIYTNSFEIATYANTRTGYTFANAWTNGSGKAFAVGKSVTGASFSIANHDDTATVTLYPKWTANTYAVQFDKNGGSGTMSSESFTYDVSRQLTKNTFTRSGYSFAGWNTKANGSGTSYSDEQSVRNLTSTAGGTVTLYAKWTANSYTVTFDANGGGTPSPASKTVTYDSLYGDLATISRTGYAFGGWYTAASGGTKVTSATSVKITAAQTLYAHWTANTYTVTFDANGGGTPSKATQTVTYDSTYGDLATISRTGHTFDGWYTAASGGTKVTSATTVKITAAQTLYAHWTAQRYMVTFSPQIVTRQNLFSFPDISYGSSGTGTLAVDGVTCTVNLSDDTITLNGTLETSSSTLWTGWLDFSSLFAGQAEPYYGLEFQYVSGSKSSVGNVVLDLADADGQNFSDRMSSPVSYLTPGNSSDASRFEIANDAAHSRMATKKFKLWLWKSSAGPLTFNNYKIRVRIELGSAATCYSPAKRLATYASAMPKIPVFALDGYTLSGIFDAATGGTKYYDANCASVRAWDKVSSVPLYMQWTAKTYSVTLNQGGGSGGSSSVTATYDAALPAIAVPTRTGHTFQGYYDTSSASGGTKYYNADGTSARTWNKTSAATLYARWTAMTYTVNFNANGGRVPSPASKTVTYDSTYGTLPETTWVGHTPVGWYTEQQYGSQVYASTKVTTASEHTLFMHWIVNHYTVRFDGNGATGGSMLDESFSCEEKKPLLKNAFVRTGYQFTGWNTAADGSGDAYADQEEVLQLSATDGDTVTLYAQWSAYVYTVVYDANGGTGTMPDQAFAFDQAQNLASNAFVKGSLAFLYWRCSNGTNYLDGACVSNLTAVSGGVVTNSAVWAGTYTVRFDGNGATNMDAMAVQVFSGPDDVQALSSNRFVRVGYLFQGWATNLTDAAALQHLYGDGQQVQKLAAAGETCTLYAAWKPITYFVAFNAGEGKTVKELDVLTCTYDQSFQLPIATNGHYEASDPDLYVFDGWTNRLQGVRYDDQATVSNLCTEAGATNTLTAVWRNDAGEWSRHMHCTTLRWGIVHTAEEYTHWQMQTGTDIGGVASYTCVFQDGGGSLPNREWLAATVRTNGVLTLKCRWRSVPQGNVPRLCVGFTDSGNPSEFGTLRDDRNVDWIEWTELEIPVTLQAGKSDAVIHLAAMSVAGDVLEIDEVVWTPEGAGGDEPQPGVDNPTVTGIAFENGKLVIRSSGNAKFGYQVLSTLSLSPVDWKLEGESYQSGSDDGQRFELTVDPAEPQKFYKVEVLKKK